MAVTQLNKRSHEHGTGPRAPPAKKFKKQTHYSSDSSSESEDQGRKARDAPRPGKSNRLLKSSSNSDPEPRSQRPGTSPAPQDEISRPASEKQDASTTDVDSESSNIESGSDSGSDSVSSNASTSNSRQPRTKPKRNDPDAFANSLTKILSSKLTTNKRVDPVLSRSKEAHAASEALADSKLEAKAKRRIKEEKRLASEKGRVRDVLLGDRTDEASTSAGKGEPAGPSVAEIAMQEKRLRKTAQRGVIMLFNAVRAAQVKGEEEERRFRESGLVGSKRKEEKVGEMGRNAFLELVAGGGEAR